MPRLSFTKAAIKRAVEGVTEAGFTVARVEIAPDGKLVIYTGGSEKPEDEYN